jgi:biotin carboxyl carrier protein
MFRRFGVGLVAMLGVAAALVGTAPTASATARNGVCESGEFCLYYNSGNAGSRVDLVNSQRDYGSGSGCITFVSGGSGQGQCVKNNTASQIVGDASLRFPLGVTQADIKNRTPHWCWDSKVSCHHDYNASDIFAATGTSVLSPVNGTVMTRNVRAGSTACDSVGSTVTVKDGFGRLWYFAHMDDSPAPVVSVGQSVTKGQRLGYVGTKYHALCTDSHLHIDMRVGVDSRVSCSAAACADYGFVNDQPLLRNAFLELP